jgi:hypothetical protein
MGGRWEITVGWSSRSAALAPRAEESEPELDPLADGTNGSAVRGVEVESLMEPSPPGDAEKVTATICATTM